MSDRLSPGDVVTAFTTSGTTWSSIGVYAALKLCARHGGLTWAVDVYATLTFEQVAIVTGVRDVCHNGEQFTFTFLCLHDGTLGWCNARMLTRLGHA